MDTWKYIWKTHERFRLTVMWLWSIHVSFMDTFRYSFPIRIRLSTLFNFYKWTLSDKESKCCRVNPANWTVLLWWYESLTTNWRTLWRKIECNKYGNPLPPNKRPITAKRKNSRDWCNHHHQKWRNEVKENQVLKSSSNWGQDSCKTKWN